MPFVFASGFFFNNSFAYVYFYDLCAFYLFDLLVYVVFKLLLITIAAVPQQKCKIKTTHKKKKINTKMQEIVIKESKEDGIKDEVIE